ncbi:MAG: DNA polymerase I [Chlamydiia bacterium]|nr:DNA polymerase I [Chlamydiia bacterium]
MSKKLFILDVSGYVFRAYHALPNMTNSQGHSTHALFGFIRSVQKIFKDFHPEHVVAVFDGPENKKQRIEIYEKYKANRRKADADLPEQMALVKKFCDLSGIPTVEVAGVEADDTMGSIATKAVAEGFLVYLCTSDKDLCQLVGEKIYILNTWKNNQIVDDKMVEQIHGVPPSKIVDLLAMMGDTSDNIPGLYGFGPKTGAALLKEFGSLDEILKNPHKVKGVKKQEILREQADQALLSRRLATIHTDIPFPQDKRWFASKEENLEALREFYLEMGFNAFIRELDARCWTKKTEETKAHLVDDEKSFEKLLQNLKDQKEICFDLETTDFRPLQALPVGVGFGFKPGEAFYVPLNGKLGFEKVLKGLKPLFEDQKLSFYGHHVKYDCHVLENIGILVTNLCFDTILASYILNSAARQHSLDHLSLEFFGKVKISIKSLIGSGKKQITMDQVPIQRVCDYCSEDVDYTSRLKKIFEKELEKRKLAPLLYELELPLSRVLQKMERTGVYLDISHLEKMSIEIGKEIAILEDQIYRLAGETFNISSPKQLSHVLFEKLKIKPIKKTTTGLSTRADVLEALSVEFPIAEKVIQYRALDKLRSTYVDALPYDVNPRTGRIHPTFNQFVVATGRLSCQDPNLQNIPVRGTLGKKIREAFRPEAKGWSFLSADYSQVELRLLAHLSEDPKLIDAFKKGEDIHVATASQMFNISLSAVTSQQRHMAKAINFGIIYGQQAYGLSQELKIDVRKAANFIEAYLERYPQVKEYMITCIEHVRKTGRAVTMIGRERKIPEINSGNSQIRMMAERLAINTPLQGSAADMIKLAMLKIDRNLTRDKMKSKMVLQIHDELIFEAPDEELPSLKSMVKDEMEGVFELKIPLLVDLSVGKNWGKC